MNSKRFFLKIFLLFFFLFSSADFVFAEEEETPSLPAPAEAIQPFGTNVELNTDSSLTFVWSRVDGAASYICEYWTGDGSSPTTKTITDVCQCGGEDMLWEKCCREGGNGKVNNGFSSDPEYENFIMGAVYYWRVKSCGADGACGEFGTTWSFALKEVANAGTLTAPETVTIADKAVGKVKINWSSVAGAKSYVVSAKITGVECKWYNWLAGLFTGGVCNPYVRLFENMLGWIGLGDFVNRYDVTCPWVLWDKDVGCDAIPIISKQEGSDLPESFYIDNTCVFSKNENYEIKIASCSDDSAKSCGPYGEAIGFKVLGSGAIPPPEQIEPFYDLSKPAGTREVPVIGREDYLVWNATNCANYIGLKIWGNGVDISGEFPSQESVSFSDTELKELLNDPADLNKEYSWKVRSCWKVAYDVTCENLFSPTWKIKTVGAPPLLLSPSGGENVSTPITFKWEDIEAAGSYYYQISSIDGNIITDGDVIYPETKISYTFFRQNTKYLWRVKTCADKEGDVCGTLSSPESFSTFPLTAPTNPLPENGGTSTVPVTLRWQPDPGANFYQYKVVYETKAADEVLDGCDVKQIIPASSQEAPITEKKQFFLSSLCLGDYQWRVRSCFDEKCTIASDWDSSPIWRFTAVQPTPSKWDTGIVPCGRRYNDPNTPYNEREPCQLKHIGFMFQNIIDFILWRVGLIVLVILTIITGFIYYSSMGNTERIIRIKTMWRAAGTGFMIMLLAWTVINILLAALGYQVEFFGKWWKIDF
jgi:hypothetical protein